LVKRDSSAPPGGAPPAARTPRRKGPTP